MSAASRTNGIGIVGRAISYAATGAATGAAMSTPAATSATRTITYTSAPDVPFFININGTAGINSNIVRGDIDDISLGGNIGIVRNYPFIIHGYITGQKGRGVGSKTNHIKIGHLAAPADNERI